MPRHIHPNPFIIRPPEDLVRRLPDLRRLGFSLGLKYASQQVVTEEDLQIMGGALWNALDLKDAFDAAHKSAGAAILPIIIESGAADAQALPWETLHHPTHGFLGKHAGFTLTRRMGEPQNIPLQLEKGPLRVLLFTSLPDDVDPEKSRLNVEEEQIQVQEALMPWISKGFVQLEMPDDGRFSTLKELLKKFQPHILFLSGHGNFHHEPHTGEDPYGEFLFESEAGDGKRVREDEIAKALIGSGVQVVVLSACESSKTAPASDALTNGLTQHISTQGIPHVIGMRESILDKAGIQFARALCDELAQRERIDIALQTARAAIQTPLTGISREGAGSSASAELSLGQWCLPMLLSPNPGSPLIDWDFQPQEIKDKAFNKSLSAISLPARFVGRRAEMRQYKNELFKGKIQKLLITGPGGQGKTSLAGKLALDLRQARGYQIFAWSARLENPWREFEFEMELALDETRAKKYDYFRPRFENDAERAKFMLDLLMQQFDGRVVFFFDNLESLQDPDTLALLDGHVTAWIQAAQSTAGLILLATSRWQIPDWDGEYLLLSHANYGDFLQMAQRSGLPADFMQKREQLRRVYDVLGGNSRGLELFAAATKEMENIEEEDAFLDALAHTKGELQSNMSIEAIYTRLPEAAKKLLARLPAYQQPVPLEGILKLGLDLPNPEALIERLLAVSLLEAQSEPRWDVVQYQCAPLVLDWMGARGFLDEDLAWLNIVADYYLYLRQYERRTLTQSVITHHALRRAKRDTEADRLTLETIVGPLTMAGFYMTLLNDWLPRVCNSNDLQTRAEALGQTGKLLHHLGDFEHALPYMKQSLTIRQQIGDKEGEGATLNNISGIYQAQGDYETALTYLKQSLTIQQQIGDKKGESVTLNNISQILQVQGDYETALEYSKRDLAICQQIGDKAGMCVTLFNMGHMYARDNKMQEAVQAWVTVYVIAKQINEFKVLQALSKLAPQLGMPEGLEGWEQLAQRMSQSGGGGGKG